MTYILVFSIIHWEHWDWVSKTMASIIIISCVYLIAWYYFITWRQRSHISQPTSPNTHLSDEQMQHAYIWYLQHQTHVDKLIKDTDEGAFPPTLAEDKRDCKLWKPGHWRWFMAHYNYINN